MLLLRLQVHGNLGQRRRFKINIGILYDYRPTELKFPYSGLQILGYTFAQELRKQGHRVWEGNIFGSEVIPQQVEVAVGIGYWGDMPYLKRFNYKKLVAYMVTDGKIPQTHRNMINEFSKTLVTSNVCRDIAARDGLKDVEVLYPGIDLELFKPDKKLRTDYVTWMFLHGGDREILEAIPYVLEKKNDAKFLSKIHYPVTKEHFSWVKPLISELKIENNVSFLDALISYDQMPQFYNKSYMHLNMGGVIGFEFGICEANACELPVIVTESGTAPELVMDGLNGYTVSVNKRETRTETKAGQKIDETYVYCKPQELANRILDLLEDKGRAKRMGENGRKLVERKFDIKKQAKRMVELIG